MAYTVTGQKHPDNEAERLDMLLRPFSIIGSVVIGWVNKLGSATLFLFLSLLKTFRPKQLSKIIQQLYYIGARSTTIIMLVSLFTGMVLGLQSHHALIQFGAQGNFH